MNQIAKPRYRRPAGASSVPMLSTPDYVSQYVQQPLVWHYTAGQKADETDTVAAFPGILSISDVLGSDGAYLPPPGMVGEGLYANRMPVDALSLNSGTPSNILAVSVPPGDWDIWAIIIMEMRQIPTALSHWMASLTPVGLAVYYPDQTTSSVSGGPGSLQLSNFPMAFPLAPVIVTTTVPLSYYLNVLVQWTGGSAWAYGNIYGRRRR